MSIGPAINLSSIGAAASVDAELPKRQRSSGPSPETPEQVQPISGTVSRQEAPGANAAPTVTQQPEDEVELQRDSELENQLIVRYVDKAGNLVLQVPAEQLLNVERAIAQEFRQLKPHAASDDGGQKGESHGH